MNAAVQFPCLSTTEGHPIPLRAMRFNGFVNDIALEMKVEQEYINNETQPIEAVFTFPLPSEAVLLGMDARIGESFLKGVACEATQASQQYEDAIEEGNSAILLERTTDSLYTVNIGNVAPGEKVLLSFRYSLMHTFDGQNLRICIPAVITSRYGDFSNLVQAPSAEPITDILASYPCSFSLMITGELSKTDFTSPSHAFEREERENGVLITITNALADRDFVFLWKIDQSEELSLAKGVGPEGTVVCASLTLKNLPQEKSLSREIYLLLDCSDSMHGIAAKQMREACGHIIESLTENDRFNIAAFGSDVRFIFSKKTESVSKQSLSLAHDFLEDLDATMGKKNLGNTLNALYKRASHENPVIFLVTDGEIWPDETLFSKAQKSHCTIFPVGVGASPAEDVLRDLALLTNGRHVICSPNEDMAHVIERHFERIALLRFQVSAKWPGRPLWVWPEKPQNVFAGDSAHFFACYRKPLQGKVTLTSKKFGICLEKDIPSFSEEITSAPEAIAAIALSHHLSDLDDKKSGTLAAEYGLLTQWTKYILVHEERDHDKKPALPTIRQVPQMQAAGWRGKIDNILSSHSLNKRKAISSSIGSLAKKVLPKIKSRLSDAVQTVAGEIHKATIEGVINTTGTYSDRVESVCPSCEYPPFVEDLLIIDEITLTNIMNLPNLPNDLFKLLRSLLDKYSDEQAILGAFLIALTSIFADRPQIVFMQSDAKTLLNASQLSRENKEYIIQTITASMKCNI